MNKENVIKEIIRDDNKLNRLKKTKKNHAY